MCRLQVYETPTLFQGDLPYAYTSQISNYNATALNPRRVPIPYHQHLQNMKPYNVETVMKLLPSVLLKALKKEYPVQTLEIASLPNRKYFLSPLEKPV
jgi:hypothetical protein